MLRSIQLYVVLFNNCATYIKILFNYYLLRTLLTKKYIYYHNYYIIKAVEVFSSIVLKIINNTSQLSQFF